MGAGEEGAKNGNFEVHMKFERVLRFSSNSQDQLSLKCYTSSYNTYQLTLHYLILTLNAKTSPNSAWIVLLKVFRFQPSLLRPDTALNGRCATGSGANMRVRVCPSADLRITEP